MPVTCPRCGKEFLGDKLNSCHLVKCNPESASKVESCLCGHVATSLTQMKRHRKGCVVWQGRDAQAVKDMRRKATSLERWGVEDASHAPDVVARRKATCLERYGATNPSAKGSSIYVDVQKSLEGKRVILKGDDNPFAWSEVQEKIRATMTERYGAENPQQVLEIRERTKATCLKRWGVEDVLAVPEIRGRIKETCRRKYGGSAPSCSPDVLAKAIETNTARFGVPWTAMDPEVRQKQLDTMIAHYGSHFFASEEGKTEVRRVLKERYGVEVPSQIEGHWEKVVATFQERYGVDHPLQLPGFNEKRFKTCLERYGTPFPGRPLTGPNKFEQALWEFIPNALFVGDGKYWRFLPLLTAHKNPDFIIPGPDLERPFQGATKVVEAFGDYWHSRIRTGKVGFEHEQELIDAWAGVGFDCLVVWESDLKADPEAVRSHLAAFVG